MVTMAPWTCASPPNNGTKSVQHCIRDQISSLSGFAFPSATTNQPRRENMRGNEQKKKKQKEGEDVATWVRLGETQICHIPDAEEASQICCQTTMMPLVWVSSTAKRPNSCTARALR